MEDKKTGEWIRSLSWSGQYWEKKLSEYLDTTTCIYLFEFVCKSNTCFQTLVRLLVFYTKFYCEENVCKEQ